MMDIAELLTEHTAEHHGNKVAVIVVYGSYAVGGATEHSDLDMYAIVDDTDSKDLEVSLTFNGKTVDLWQMTWERAEQMATGNPEYIWCVGAAILEAGKVMFVRSEMDRKRFETLRETAKLDVQTRMEKALRIFGRYENSAENMRRAKAANQFMDARWCAWGLLNAIAQILAYLNNRKYTKNWGSNLHQAFEFDKLPTDFQTMVQTLALSNDFDEMINVATQLVEETRTILTDVARKGMLDPKDFLEKFGEETHGLREYVNKIRSGCMKDDMLLVSYAASELQVWTASWLQRIEDKMYYDAAFGPDNYEDVRASYENHGFPDLCSAVSTGDHSLILSAANEFEERLLAYCDNMNITGAIKHSFETLPELKEFLETRH